MSGTAVVWATPGLFRPTYASANVGHPSRPEAPVYIEKSAGPSATPDLLWWRWRNFGLLSLLKGAHAGVSERSATGNLNSLRSIEKARAGEMTNSFGL